MSARIRLRHWLQERGREVTLPPQRRLTDLRHVRLQRVILPERVTGPSPSGGDGRLTVDLDRMVNRAGFSYGRAGWHPFVAALEQHLAQPDIEYRDTVLAAFYARFRPKTVHDWLLDNLDVPRRELASWPALEPLIDLWSTTGADLLRVRSEASQLTAMPHSQYRGPTEVSIGTTHLQRTVDAHASIAAHGYRPERFPSRSVTGYFLTRENDYRFVVGHGNHRVAALRALNYRRVAVMLRPSHPPVVARERLERWTTGRGGLLTRNEATAVFDRFFANDSRERAAAMGLL